MAGNPLDRIAQRIFEAAIAEHRCGELLEALCDGATATCDYRTGKLVIIPAEQIAHLAGDP